MTERAIQDPLDAELTIHPPTTIMKRDGRTVEFDVTRIEHALTKCFASFGRRPHTHVAELAQRVVNIIAAKHPQDVPTVEEVQDTVEMVLQAAGEFEAAKRYILYRAEHAKEREIRPVPAHVRQAFEESDQYFPTPLQKFQFFDKYSRFDYETGRRETWIETVDRSVNFLREISENRLDDATYDRVRTAILEMRAMPSMRLLAMAGPAARRTNIAIYNCSYMPVDSLDSFVEALIISMSGCGVGFSVENKYIEQFPRIKRQTGEAPIHYVVDDSAEGWADALRFGLETWFSGKDVQFDLSQLRPAGAPLRIKGGRASGPEPFRQMLEFCRARILSRQGSFLRSLDAHDMMCSVGNAAVSGGVRRCLPAGTRVHTKRGAIPIEEVTTNDHVMTEQGYRKVMDWVDQGVQQILEIETQSGTIFRCTPHHRIAVLTDVHGGYTFKYARDLTQEDRLLFITHAIDGEAQSLLPLPAKRDADHSGSTVIQPTLTTETAWFLGKFFADGYVGLTEHNERGKGGNTQFSISCNTSETDQIERVQKWMENHNIPARFVHQEGNWLNIRSGNRQIARWMSHYKQPNTDLVIPEAIWRSTIDVRSAFIAGVMDGDGCYSNRPVTILSTVYETFARDMVRLLATLGIISEVHRHRPANEKGWKAQWVVSIKDALALQKAEMLIGKYSCGTWIRRKAKQAGYSVQGWMVRRDVPRKAYASLWASGQSAAMNSATLTSLVGATHYVPVKIKALHLSEEAHTYDISVEDQHVFVAEGYLVHNTAMISLFDYDDHDMLHAKDGDFDRDNSQRWNANNSAVWPAGGLTQLEIAQQFLTMVESGRGEPGIFNRQAAIDMRPERRKPAEFGTNPCVTGDTWIAVADGRGRVQMQDLVADGRDVDVYTVKDGELVIRTMRNPRKTGTNSPIYKVMFADGSFIRVTPNHKFQLTNGEFVEAVNLQHNDALVSLTVCCIGYNKENKRTAANYDTPKTYRMLQFGSMNRSEHRFIYRHHTGINLTSRDYHIHHKDFNSLNNTIENLELMSESDHQALHDVSGERNPRTIPISNEELHQKIKNYIQSLGYRPSLREYQVFAKANGLPQSFQKYRQDYFGGDAQYTLYKIAEELGIQQKLYVKKSVKISDLPVHYKGSIAFVTKVCEYCGNNFEIAFSQRDVSTCGRTCANNLYYQKNGTESLKERINLAHQKRKQLRRQQQITVYNDLVVELNRHPMKDEWINACKINGISPEISRVSSPFRYWSQLQEAASKANHRVIAVEVDGYEDVYNGTVDDTHTYFSIGCERNRSYRTEMSYVLSKNCGEILLRSAQFCNLTAAVARADDTFESLREKVEVATIIGTIQSMATNFPGLRPQWKQNCEEERLLGVDITGQMDSKVAQDPEVQRKLKQIAIDTNKEYAAKLGINQSVSVSCVKPSGNSSQLLDCSSGLHARWSPYYIRNVRVSAHSPIYKVLRDAGVPMDPENGQTRDDATTWVIHFPVKSPEGAITRNSRGAIEQCNYWLQNKLNWTEHNPSVTITYKPDEVMDVMKWVWEHRDVIGGMAFLPSFDANYAQLPYMEIGKEEYEKLAAEFPPIDFSKIYRYEEEDLTTAAQELACSSGACEVDFL